MFGLFGKSWIPEKDIPDLSGKVILVTGGGWCFFNLFSKYAIACSLRHEDRVILVSFSRDPKGWLDFRRHPERIVV